MQCSWVVLKQRRHSLRRMVEGRGGKPYVSAWGRLLRDGLLKGGAEDIATSVVWLPSIRCTHGVGGVVVALHCGCLLQPGVC